MNTLRRKILILFGGAAFVLGGFCVAHGQIGTVRVYNPNIYSGTRTTMSNRAAARAALRKARQRAAARKAAEKRRQAVRKRRPGSHNRNR